MSIKESIKILIVEDDLAIANMLSTFFVSNGASVCLAKNGKEALAMAESCEPSVIILDVVLPYIDGFTVLRQLRAKSCDLPVILLTEKKTVAEKLEGFEAGADDYVTKPFSPQELQARVHAVLRRPARETAFVHKKVINAGGLSIDPAAREVSLSGMLFLPLTKTEFDLLYYLADQKNVAVTRGELLTNVLGYNPGSQTKSLAMHITNIRKKFEQHGVETIKLQAVPAVGYKLVVIDPV